MNCKDAEKAIPGFMEDSLENRELQKFVEHIDHCEECREELSIQFLITEGMNQLEGGNAFDLKNAFDQKLDQARERLRFRKGVQAVIYIMEALVVIAIIIIFVLLYVL